METLALADVETLRESNTEIVILGVVTGVSDRYPLLVPDAVRVRTEEGEPEAEL